MSELKKLLAVVVPVVALVVTVSVFARRSLVAAAGPEAELVTLLKEAEVRGLELATPAHEVLRGVKVQYQRLSVVVSGERAVVTGTLDFTGRLEREHSGALAAFDTTTVSSLGFERVVFVRVDGEWQAQAGLAPRLTGVVAALEAHRRAREAASGDDAGVPTPTHTRLRVDAWFIRSERDAVEIAEDSVLTGDLPDRPVALRETRHLTLVEEARENDGFRSFVLDGGMM